jgi:hypothetical protein
MRGPIAVQGDEEWCTAREKFLERCSALQGITDQTQGLAYLKYSFHEPMSRLGLILAPGENLPRPIAAPGLKGLVISASHLTKYEKRHSKEASYFTSKVKRLCQTVKNLDRLDLHPPGLSAPITSERDRLPSQLQMRDPFPRTLEYIRGLSMTTSNQFCTVDKGDPREAHWVSSESEQSGRELTFSRPCSVCTHLVGILLLAHDDRAENHRDYSYYGMEPGLPLKSVRWAL